MLTTIKYICGFAIFFGIMGVVGQMDYEDELLAEQAYCDMVILWEDERARGVPENDRAGWPPFKPEVACNL